MKTKEFLAVLLLAVLAAPILNAVIYSVAFAHGHSGLDPLLAIGATDAGFEWNPLAWPWPEIITTVLTVLGAMTAVLRLIAPKTKSDKDDKLLSFLEWVAIIIAKVVVPKQLRAASLGGGKTPAADYQRGGKNGEDA